MKDNECRIIKIEKDALYEFIYESFIASHEEFMDETAVGNGNTFTIDWETGTFLFCSHKSENERGESVPFPRDINLDELIKVLPATTNSVLVSGKKYEDYSFEELRRIVDKK